MYPPPSLHHTCKNCSMYHFVWAICTALLSRKDHLKRLIWCTSRQLCSFLHLRQKIISSQCEKRLSNCVCICSSLRRSGSSALIIILFCADLVSKLNLVAWIIVTTHRTITNWNFKHVETQYRFTFCARQQCCFKTLPIPNLRAFLRSYTTSPWMATKL